MRYMNLHFTYLQVVACKDSSEVIYYVLSRMLPTNSLLTSKSWEVNVLH